MQESCLLQLRNYNSYFNMSSIVTSIKREQSIVRPMLLVDKGQPVDAANDLAVSGSSFAFVVVLTLAAFMF